MIRHLTAFFLLLGCLAQGAPAQSLEAITEAREAKLAEALARLKSLRSEIQEEQIPLARELQQLDHTVQSKEEKLAEARRLRDSEDVELQALEERVLSQQRELDYVTRTLLPEHFANFDAALSPGERATIGESIREYNLFLEDPEIDEVARLERSLALLRDSFRHLETVIGGKRYPGGAVDPDGRVIDGRFAQVGPLLYFAEPEGIAGWVDDSSGLHASITPLAQRHASGIGAVARTGEGVLPVDPTLGDALVISQTREGLLEHLRKGGVWVYPILLFALAATIVALFKIVQIYRIRDPRPMAIHEIVKALRAGDGPRALELAHAQPEPTREMLVAAVDHADESIEMVEEVMYESMLTTQPRLERFLNVIAVTAAAAPLLGLLGTVTGIIKTFRLMTVFGAGDPKPLISGISEALITTELGLVLAIPALVLHAMLSRKVSGIMARLEKASVAFVNGLSRRSLAPATR